MKRMFAALLVAAGLAIPLFAMPGIASAQVYLDVSVGYAPPPIPWYPQPFCPGVGYIWTPGYWAYGPYGYYWVPGTWVLAPAVGLLWTPGYWAWDGGYYWWHTGYWGPTVGFYGGINYGYGYDGDGYWGGYWRGRSFYYNRAVTSVDVTYIHNTYVQPVRDDDRDVSRVSYNGGRGGVYARPTAMQWRYAREHHFGATELQLRQEHLAMNDPQQRFAVNQGRPQIVATRRPGVFAGANVVRMHVEHTGYRDRSGTDTTAPARSNEIRVQSEAPVRALRFPVNEERQRTESVGNGRPLPDQVREPRAVPMPVSAQELRGGPLPAAQFNGGYRMRNVPQRPQRIESAGRGSRIEMPHPESFRSVSVRPAFRSAPHFQMRAPARGSGHPRGGGRPR